jgi:hypothetical protein
MLWSPGLKACRRARGRQGQASGARATRGQPVTAAARDGARIELAGTGEWLRRGRTREYNRRRTERDVSRTVLLPVHLVGPLF